MSKINVDIELNIEPFIDSIINAIELYSGCWMNPVSTTKLQERIENGEVIEIFESENNKFIGVLSKDSIIKGIKETIEYHSSIYHHIMYGDIDIINYDGFLQLCVLGEIVYG